MPPRADHPGGNPSNVAGSPSGRSRGLLAAALLLCALATLAPRLWGLADMPLVEDECFHAELSSKPWGEILDHCRVSPTYPGWYLPYKLWLLAAPGSDLGRKALSVLWGCLGVLGMFWLGREAGGRRAGWVAALLLALCGYHVNYSQIATPYAFIMFLGVVATWSLLVVLRRGSRRAAVIHALAMAWVFYSHPTAVFLWGAEVAAALMLLAAGRRAHLRLFAMSSGLALVLSAGALYLMGHHWQVMQQSGGAAYIPEVSLEVVRERLHNLGAFGSSMSWAGPLELLAAMAAAAAGLWAAVALFREPAESSAQRQAERWPAAVLLCIWLLPFLVSMAAGVIINREIFYEARFFALFVPAGCALLALAATWRLEGRLRRLRPALLAAVLALALIPQIGSLRYLFGGGRAADRFPVRQVMAHLRTHARAGDVAVVHHSWYLSFFRRYHLNPRVRVVGAVHQQIQQTPYGGVRDPTRPGHVDRLMTAIKGHGRVFLVLSPGALQEWRDPGGLVEKAMDRRFRLVHRVCFNCERFAAVVKLYETGPARAGQRAAEVAKP